MQIENNYDKDVFNGDIGFVTHIDADEQELTATFDAHVVTYAFGELDELTLSYATTIHKSQGSEYPVVIIPVSTQHYMMLNRNLIYTGITRGKQLVVLVGQTRALAIAVKPCAEITYGVKKVSVAGLTLKYTVSAPPLVCNGNAK